MNDLALKQLVTPYSADGKIHPYFRPYVCNGNKEHYKVFLVGINPATPICEKNKSVDEYIEMLRDNDVFHNHYEQLRLQNGMTKISMLERRLIIIIKNLLTFLLMSILLTACSTADDVRDPLSVEEINWKYLSTDVNSMNMENVKVYGQNEFDIATMVKEFCVLMLNNPDKIYANESDSTVKIYLRFNETSGINIVYTEDEYEGKESTFFVDESLLPALEGLQEEYGEN
ncbi:hypothetical protein [Paenisporosarcina sp.]|uniref:hypothetical protein n=1 Tax=Paenisporosarcina sp. TaxID=1932001 RepID=UPI003C70E725